MKQEDKKFFDVLTCTSVQVYPFKDPAGKAKAYASVVLNEQLTLTNLKIVDGVNGYFVAYPVSTSNKKDDYRSVYYPLNKELREHIEISILEKYQDIVTAGKKNETKKEEV